MDQPSRGTTISIAIGDLWALLEQQFTHRPDNVFHLRHDGFF